MLLIGLGAHLRAPFEASHEISIFCWGPLMFLGSRQAGAADVQLEGQERKLEGLATAKPTSLPNPKLYMLSTITLGLKLQPTWIIAFCFKSSWASIVIKMTNIFLRRVQK